MKALWCDAAMRNVLIVILVVVLVLFGSSKLLASSSLPPGVLSTYELWQLTNEERTRVGAKPLKLSAEVSRVADIKCRDMASKKYWSHDTPTEGWEELPARELAYSLYGENIAYGYASAKDTVNGWMNSPPHRQALLSDLYNEVGFSSCLAHNYRGHDTVVIVVQHLRAVL